MAFPSGELTRQARALEYDRDQLGEDDFQRGWESGQAMELGEAVRYTLDGGRGPKMVPWLLPPTKGAAPPPRW
jgi:hypothetical protein